MPLAPYNLMFVFALLSIGGILTVNICTMLIMFHHSFLVRGGRDSSVDTALNSWVTSLNPGWSGGTIFFSGVKVLCWLLFGVRSVPVSPQWHVQDPGHSWKSAGGSLHLNVHTPLTQRSRSGLTMLFMHNVGTYQGNELTRYSSGNTRPQSSQLVETLWTDPCLKSGIGVCQMISILKK